MNRLQLAALLVFSSAALAAETKTVLFLESAEPGAVDMTEFLDGFRTAVAEQWPEPVRTELQFLSLADFGSEKFSAWFQEKHRDRKVDLIGVFERPPVTFASTFRDRVWPEKPLIVTGITAAQAEVALKKPNVTAVFVEQDIHGFLEMAERLCPKAQALAFVSTMQYLRQEDREWWTREAHAFAMGRMEFITVTGLPLNGIKLELQSLPRNSLVLLRNPIAPIARTPAAAAALQEVLAASPAPVFCVTGADMKDGVVGSMSMNYRKLGMDMAAQAVAVFRAGKASDVPPASSHPFEMAFDWRELQRWNLNEKLLPPGAVVRNRPPGLWEAHRGTMLAISAALALLSGVVVVLLLQRRWRRLADIALRAQREEFSRTLRAATVSRLASSLTHELNQPLTAIISNADAAGNYLDREDADPRKVRQILADIADDAHRAGEVMQGVRSMVCKEGGERRKVSLNDLITSARRTLLAEARARNCTLVEELADKLPAVDVNPVQIQQVLLNLVFNAFDAVDAPDATSRRVVIRTAAESSKAVRLSVRDFGPGLPPGGVEKLFEQFYTTKPGGMGMGLAIARDVMESHGGSLDAENAEGGGAQFSIRLPIADENNPIS